MTVEKPKPKQLLRPITTGTNSAMNQSQFLAMTCNSLEAREKSRVRGAIGFGFDSHWLKNWRDSFQPITKRSNRNDIITFDSHLKTALMVNCLSLFRETTYLPPMCPGFNNNNIIPRFSVMWVEFVGSLLFPERY